MPGAARQRLGRLLADLLGGPGAEVELDRGGPAAQPQRGDRCADRRNAADLVLPAKAHPGEARPGVGRQQAALAQPAPERARSEDRVGAEVGLVGPIEAAGAAAQLLVGLEKPHVTPASAHEIAAVRPAMPPPTIVIGAHASTLRSNWPAVKVQLWSLKESQLPWPGAARSALDRAGAGAAARAARGEPAGPDPQRAGSLPARGCPPRARWPSSSGCLAGSCSRPTRSSSPRAIWSRARARRRGSPRCRRSSARRSRRPRSSRATGSSSIRACPT